MCAIILFFNYDIEIKLNSPNRKEKYGVVYLLKIIKCNHGYKDKENESSGSNRFI